MTKASRVKFHFRLGITLALGVWMCVGAFLVTKEIPLFLLLCTTSLILVGGGAYTSAPRKMQSMLHGIVVVSLIPFFIVFFWLVYTALKPGVQEVISLIYH